MSENPMVQSSERTARVLHPIPPPVEKKRRGYRIRLSSFQVFYPGTSSS